MIRNLEYKEKRKGYKRVIISVYLGLMMLFYLGYILMDNYHLSKSEQWINTDYLTQGDIQNIQQLNFWTSMFENSFWGLIILATLLLLFRYRKNKKALIHFIILHLCLFTTLFLIGYILSFFLISPIGNLTEPLTFSALLPVIIVIYTAFVLINERLSKSI
ncbi:hypothetical protein [Neobacillus sp. PS3-40]|uniref:hypothetical protein n=1 Tax=Neobacillus sp. PS3-40 TaxID=3070679 RepID=UPI0027DF6655|nr:hypothetical protein [Neobacillus sp. PS3-40]WML44624.1 hypothetical protein RCG20_01540 [Neobacillus sp. PS3-40]